MDNQTTQSTPFEQTIAAALADPSISSAKLTELVPHTEAALVAAEATAQAERWRSLDAIASTDTAEAEKVVWAAEFRRDRLHSCLSHLRQRITEMEEAEYAARWEVDFETVKAERDAAAKEMCEHYPKVVAELIDLFRRILTIDEECSRVNGTAPDGEFRRLRGVELAARGLESFSVSNPAITGAVKLPEWKDSDRLAWPPPKTPLGVLVAAAMTPPQDAQFTANWAAAREQDMIRRAETERRWAKEEEARRAESKRAYEASLRR